VDNISGDIGQPKIATGVIVSQSLVVKSQQMEDRSVKIVHVDFVRDGVMSNVIRCTVRDA
jgi:hypothetical protein